MGGCSKLDPSLNVIPNPSDSTGLGDNQPAITAIGYAVGPAITVTIGIAGGTIVSTDSAIELNIPAGALATNTSITIQPVTNECPGGIGLGYDLLPNGTKFMKPATLSFHYKEDDMDGTNPLFCFIAFQDSLQQWQAELVNGGVDTVAKSIDVDITHFTQYALLKIISITNQSDASQHMLMENETAGLSVRGPGDKPLASSNSSSNSQGGDDELTPLVTPKRVPDRMVSMWAISPQKGSISGTGNNAIYKAPSNIKTIERIQVSCSVKIEDVVVTKFRNPNARNRWKGILPSNYVNLYTKLTIRPTNMSYNLMMETHEKKTSGIFDDNYSDTAEMEIDIKGNYVNIPASSIKNHAPHVLPTSGNNGDFIATWVPDGVGKLNITGASAKFDQDEKQNDVILITFDHENEVTAKWQWVVMGSGGAPSYIGGVDVSKNSSDNIQFPFEDNTIIMGIGNDQQFFRFTIVPIH